MQSNGKITYSYKPETWSQEEFLRLGGFTVVFLNYNKARYIEKSVASALSQDFPLCEMFFMDDASTDGSGDTMERIVREYSGRHKVSVVRNDENQYITGQWNIVAKLATGNWLGMFCGDDVAHSDRVSLIAERISKYPSLRGIATAAVDIDINTGSPLPDSHYVKQPYFASGTDSWADLHANFASNGSTSFWHRSLFNDPLEKVPLDDVLLHFRVYVLNRGVQGPVFFYDSSIKTIDYSQGAGVCGGGVVVDRGMSRRKQWVAENLQYKAFLAKSAKTFSIAISYALQNNIGRRDLSSFVGFELWCRIRSGSLMRRAFQFPAILIAALGMRRISLKQFFSLVRSLLYYSCFECLGLNVAYVVRSALRKKR